MGSNTAKAFPDWQHQILRLGRSTSVAASYLIAQSRHCRWQLRDTLPTYLDSLLNNTQVNLLECRKRRFAASRIPVHDHE